MCIILEGIVSCSVAIASNPAKLLESSPYAILQARALIVVPDQYLGGLWVQDLPWRIPVNDIYCCVFVRLFTSVYIAS